jgi:hypothetical protein
VPRFPAFAGERAAKPLHSRGRAFAWGGRARRIAGMKKLVRRWHWWLPTLLVAAGLGYVGYRAMHPPWEETEAWEKYEQVYLGMPFDDALAVLGDGPPFIEIRDADGKMRLADGTFEYMEDGWFWWETEDNIFVRFDKSNRVERKAISIQGHFFSEPPLRRHWWDRWRARLGW